jgi:dihydroxy-acid dehydratase
LGQSRSRRTGHLVILRGNLAPEGAVAKISGKEGLRFEGRAICFDSEEKALQGHPERQGQEGARGRHPLRRPEGRPRHARDAVTHRRDHGQGARQGRGPASPTAGSAAAVPRLRHRPCHPEAHDGGPIALVRNGDVIVIDASTRTMDVAVPAEELVARRAAWVAPPLKATRGTLAKYIRLVRSASEGCVTD